MASFNHADYRTNDIHRRHRVVDDRAPRPPRRSTSTHRISPPSPNQAHRSASTSSRSDLALGSSSTIQPPSVLLRPGPPRPPPSPTASTFSVQSSTFSTLRNASNTHAAALSVREHRSPSLDQYDNGITTGHQQSHRDHQQHLHNAPALGPPIQRLYQGQPMQRLAAMASSSSLTLAENVPDAVSHFHSRSAHPLSGSPSFGHGRQPQASVQSSSFPTTHPRSSFPSQPTSQSDPAAHWFPEPQHQTAAIQQWQPSPSPSPVEDPYDILSAYATDSNADDGSEHTIAATPAQSEPAPRKPAPWAYKPRVGLQDPVEANAAPSRPMGLKHEEASAPTAFIVDEDFERVVQQIVPNFDHPETPSLTIRVFVLGTLFCVLLAFANTIFSFRTNPFIVTPYVAILLAYPIGKFLEHYVPNYVWYTRWFKVSLNPGPFTVKEHVLIGIWATTGAGGAYGTANIVVQELYYKINLGHLSYTIFLVCLNLIGFGLSGLMRSWVIRPPEMIWPSVLPFVSLYSAFHGGLKRDTSSDSDSIIDPSHKSKIRFFFMVIAACFIYHIVGPYYMAAGVTSIPLLCLAVPKTNFFLRTVVGSPVLGVGAFSFAVDWAIVGSTPMILPFWSTVSSTIGTVALQWIATPLGSYYNWFGAPPNVRYHVNSIAISQGNGDPLPERDLVKEPSAQGVEINWDTFEKLKPFHMTTFFAMAYFSSMAQFMSAFVHVVVWYGKDIYQRIRGVNKSKEGLDRHCLFIDQYPEVPYWLYLLLLVVTSAGAVIVFQFTAMAMPWYMTLLSIGFSAVACFPIALILATTGVQLYLNVVSQFILGLMMPGFPIVQMAFKSLAVSVGQQCMTLLTDLKLGHYMKIPPRHVFITQVSASIVSAIASYFAVVFWLTPDEHRRWILRGDEITQPSMAGFNWKSNGNRTFYSASVIWGLIGPRRFFFETPYGAVIFWGLAFGALTPIVIKMFDLVSGKYIPWKYVQGPLLFNGVIAGADGSYVFTGLIVALWSQFFMYRYRANWWKRYNYITACALDVGVALAAFVSIFVLQGFGIEFPKWALNPGDDQTLGDNLDFCAVKDEYLPKDLVAWAQERQSRAQGRA